MLHKRVASRWLHRNAGSKWEPLVQKLLREGKYQEAAMALVDVEANNSEHHDRVILDRLEFVHKSKRFLWVHDTELGLLDRGTKNSPFSDMVREEYNNIRYALLSDPYLKLRMCYRFHSPLADGNKYPYIGRGITADDIQTHTLMIHYYRQHEHFHDNPQTLVIGADLYKYNKPFAKADSREIMALGMSMREAVDALRYFNPKKEKTQWHKQTGRDA